MRKAVVFNAAGFRICVRRTSGMTGFGRHAGLDPASSDFQRAASSRASLHRPCIAALLLALSGCLSAPPLPPVTADKPELRPEVFFAGRTRGSGELEVRGRGGRAFTVESLGRAESDGAFRVDQTITYADGAVETRSWTVRRTEGNTYRGTITGAAGEVVAETTGNVLHLRYLIRHPAVYMDQRLYLQPDGRSAINFATVTVAGVAWARLAEQIVRTD